MISIYKLNDYEYYAGESMEECIEFGLRFTGLDRDELLDGPRELRDEEYDNHIFHDDMYDKRAAGQRTFREELNSMLCRGDEFPCLFASSIW